MDFRKMQDFELDEWYSRELREAFPPQECKPLADIREMISADRYELWGLYEQSTLLGYAGLWKADNVPLVLLDYLGVTNVRRNQGLGSLILRALHQQTPLLVAEAELPVERDGNEENDLRLRRICFYRRNGFVFVYRMATCGLAWQALVSDTGLTPIRDVMRWHRQLYGPERRDVRIPLPDGETPIPPYWMH